MIDDDAAAVLAQVKPMPERCAVSADLAAAVAAHVAGRRAPERPSQDEIDELRARLEGDSS